MTVAGLGQTAFLEILKANGYECLSHTHWDLEGVERIVLGKDKFDERVGKPCWRSVLSIIP